MTAAERFVKRMLGCITSSSDMSPNSGDETVEDELVSALMGDRTTEDELPQGETLQDHDRKHHKGHFDPSTQTCKYREEMAVETDADKADIADEDRESKGNKKDSAEHSQPLVSPEEDKAYMEAVERGDMETAAKMVREVAGRAFPNTKVVDKDGAPKIVFHNTDSSWTVPVVPWEGPIEWDGLPGLFFADKEQPQYGKNKISCFVNLINPLDMNDGGRKFLHGRSSDQIDAFTKQYEEAIKTGGNEFEFGDDGVLKITPKGMSLLKYDGYFGEHPEDETGKVVEYAVMSARQVKSADPVTYDDDGNVIPLSRRFDDGDDIRGDIRGDVSGSSPSESNGEEFGESFYASVYPDRDESFSAEFAPAMEEESRKADESYAANFSKDGTYKLPFANGRFGKGIMDKVREEQKKQAEEAKRQEEEQKRQAETEQTIFENITKGMESISAEDAQEYISGLFTTLKDCGEVQRKAENRLARYPKKRKQETLRFVAATLKDVLPRYPKIADALAHCAFYPCRPRSSDSYAAVTRALYKDSGRVELKGQFMAFPYTHREQDELSFDSDGGKHMAWCIDNYPTNDVMANRACFMHEVGHLLMNGKRYEDKENNEVAWGKIVNEGRREMEKWDSNISLYPQTCDTGRTRLIELHSECVALFTMPGYGQDSNLPKLPKCVEEYLRKELIG